MIKMRFNEKSWSAKIESLIDQTEDSVREGLVRVAGNLAIRAPVDTGAYAESFSVVPASFGGGRSRTSRGRPRRQDKEAYQSIALSNMTKDINSIELLENKSVSFRNRAPHAQAVEDKYHIFSTAKDISR
jgi:hypothetical protein